MGKKSELLLDDDQLVIVQTKLAVLVGDRQAIALQQVHYWSNINQKADKVEHYTDDQWWVYNTWAEWQQKNFPFWSMSTLRRVFRDLEAEGLIITRPHENKNKGVWVTINYGQLEVLLSQQAEPPRVKRLRQRAEVRTERAADRSAQIEQAPENEVGSAQIEQTGLLKLNRRSVQNEQDTGTPENTETNHRKEHAPANAVAPSVDVKVIPFEGDGNHNEWYDVAFETWGVTAGRNTDMVKLLRGTATKKGYKQYNLTKPLERPSQLVEWKLWYLNVKCRGKRDTILPVSPEKVQSSIGEWQVVASHTRQASPAAAEQERIRKLRMEAERAELDRINAIARGQTA